MWIDSTTGIYTPQEIGKIRVEKCIAKDLYDSYHAGEWIKELYDLEFDNAKVLAWLP